MSSETSKPKRYKLVIVGDGACGKTSLLTVFKTGVFPGDEYLPTVFESDVSNMNVDGTDIELTLWDTAGQEFYDKLRRLSYPADVVLICFAIDRPETLANVRKRWAPEVERFCQGVPVVLVGNKTDLRNDPVVISNLEKIGKTPVSMAQIRQMADVIQATAYHECSAKYINGVDNLFNTAARAAMKAPRRRRNYYSCSNYRRSYCCALI